MADEIEKKDKRFYDIDEEEYKENLKKTAIRFMRQVVDEEEFTLDPKPTQTVTVLFDTKIRKKKNG